MRELMLKVEYLKRSSIYIGKVGESNSTRIKIDAAYWRNKFSNISFEAIYRRADGISYPVKISTDENYIIWDISRKDLYKAGTAYLTLIGYELEKKIISTTAMCFVNPGINGITVDSEYTEDLTPTDWIQSVLDEVGDLKNSIYAEIEHAVSSAGHLKREIVDELPDLDAADKDTIYMIKRVDSDDYIEYIIIETDGTKRFDQIGDTKIDLSGYVEKIIPESDGNLAGLSIDGSLIDTKISPQLITDQLTTHITNYSNPHGVTKVQIGLSNVTNDAQVKGLSNGTTNSHIVTWGDDGYTVADSGKTVNDFATAAQGTLAENAMPKAGGIFTGSVSGIVPTDDANLATKAYVDAQIKANAASVFKFKGTVATVGNLPTAIADIEGNVYHVNADHGEYVCAQVDDSNTYTWEPLGDVIDLTDYALSADVIQRVSDSEGYIPKFTADGTLTSTNFKLGKSIPADAIFTDITQVTANNGLNVNITDRSLTLGITSISTDLLVNGANTLVINCGTAT